MAGIELRPYQLEAVDAALKAVDEGIYRPVIVLPTGTGKSFTMAELVCREVEKGGRVLVLAHRGELLKQIRKSVTTLDPEITTGIVKATRREYDADVILASVQTLAAGEEHLGEIGDISLILVDEAHHYAAPSYQQVLIDAGAFELGAEIPVVGFTATYWRSDGGLDRVWSKVVYEKTISWAIENGYLVRPRAKVVVSEKFDLSDVRVVAGDFVTKDLEEAMMASVESTVQSFLTHCKDYATIVFAAGVDHAQALAQGLTSAGYPAEVVVGSMTTEERDTVYAKFNSGEINVMVTVTVLTEGADFPRCQCVLMARPTHSKSLYTQMVGRALRLYPGKDTAYVIDLSGASRKMSLASLTDVLADAETEFSTTEGDPVEPPEEVEEQKPRKQRHGVLELEEIDLLEARWEKTAKPRWLKTSTGKLFLPGKRYYTYVQQNPYDSRWYALTVTAEGALLGDVYWDYPCNTVEEAMEVAQEKAREINDLPLRSANQFKNLPPTEKQVQFGQFLGIDDAENMTKARLQDEISKVMARRRIGD